MSWRGSSRFPEEQQVLLEQLRGQRVNACEECTAKLQPDRARYREGQLERHGRGEEAARARIKRARAAQDLAADELARVEQRKRAKARELAAIASRPGQLTITAAARKHAEGPLSRPCTVRGCEAPPGAPCVRPGTTIPRATPHAPRRRAATAP